jgi:hypothetical protein
MTPPRRVTSLEHLLIGVHEPNGLSSFTLFPCGFRQPLGQLDHSHVQGVLLLYRDDVPNYEAAWPRDRITPKSIFAELQIHAAFHSFFEWTSVFDPYGRVHADVLSASPSHARIPHVARCGMDAGIKAQTTESMVGANANTNRCLPDKMLRANATASNR